MERALWMAVLKVTRTVRSAEARPRRPVYHDRLVLRLYLWAVLHDRPLCWACRRTSYGRLFRPHQLPSVSQLCRRVATRYEKLALHFLAMVKLAMIQRCLRLLDPSNRA